MDVVGFDFALGPATHPALCLMQALMRFRDLTVRDTIAT
jgi:hypothetical protein